MVLSLINHVCMIRLHLHLFDVFPEFLLSLRGILKPAVLQIVKLLPFLSHFLDQPIDKSLKSRNFLLYSG